jgi:FMN phosphatase YigB (HAD superfamily)
MENSLNQKDRIRVIALDFDGVVTNLDINWNSAIHTASMTAGYDVKSLLTFYENSHGTPVFQRVSSEIEKLELNALNSAQPAPLIKEFLRRISACHVETYMVSIQSAPVIEKFLSKHNLESYFKEILTREKFPSKKAQIAYILDKSKANPREVLLVDDLESNIVKCKELGIECFHFARRQDKARIKQMWNSIIDRVQGCIH